MFGFFVFKLQVMFQYNSEEIQDQKDFAYYRHCLKLLVEIFNEQSLIDLVCRFAEGDTQQCCGSECKYIMPNILRNSINKTF